MIAKKILSPQHPRIKYFVNLRKDKAFRQEKQRVLISGKKMVFELAKSFPIHTLILDESFFDSSKVNQSSSLLDKSNYQLENTSDNKFRIANNKSGNAENNSNDPLENINIPIEKLPVQAKEILLVPTKILQKITGLENPEPVAAEIDLPSKKVPQKERWILVLDQISDPGNFGTLLRSALAFSWEGVILTPNTVDPFNEKALRAAKGATFHIPLFFLSKEEILAFSLKQKIPLYLADMEGENLQKVSPSCGLLILSNESHGASAWPNAKKITIPISNNVDSLNVSVAGSILLYFLKAPTCV